MEGRGRRIAEPLGGNMAGTQKPDPVTTKQQRLAELATQSPQLGFISLNHYLDLLAPGVGLHGEKCGIGTIMMSKLHGLDWEGVRSALEQVKAPTTASEMDLKEGQVVEALVKASSIRPERYTILSRNKLSRERALRLAKSTGVV